MDGGASRAYPLPLGLTPPMSPNHSQDVVREGSARQIVMSMPWGNRKTNPVCLDSSSKCAGRSSLVRGRGEAEEAVGSRRGSGRLLHAFPLLVLTGPLDPAKKLAFGLRELLRGPKTRRCSAQGWGLAAFSFFQPNDKSDCRFLLFDLHCLRPEPCLLRRL